MKGSYSWLLECEGYETVLEVVGEDLRGITWLEKIMRQVRTSQGTHDRFEGVLSLFLLARGLLALRWGFAASG